MTTIACIYCLRSDGVTFRGKEHVIPQAFGTFGSETPTLDSVCDDCNGYFGRELDQLLARETWEGITRYQKGQLSSELRVQKRLKVMLAPGDEVGDFAGVITGGIDGTTGRVLPPPPQLHVLNRKSGQKEVFFARDLPTLVLDESAYGTASAPGQSGMRTWWVLGNNAAEFEIFVVALKRRFPHFEIAARFQPPAFASLQDDQEQSTLPIMVEGTIDALQKRAIAKVLFNFTAKYVGTSEVRRPEWDKARNFIRYGNGSLKLWLTQEPFWSAQETNDFRFEDDSINIRVENGSANVIGLVQFYNLFTYHIVLAQEHQLEHPVAMRFTPGMKPMTGEARSRHNRREALIPPKTPPRS